MARLDKRSRAALRQKEAARALALRRADRQGRCGSMWGRFFPVLRPVGKPLVDWSYNWRTAARIRREAR